MSPIFFASREKTVAKVSDETKLLGSYDVYLSKKYYWLLKAPLYNIEL